MIARKHQGIKIVDSKRNLYVNVSQKNIESAIKHDPNFCVFALGLREEKPNLIFVYVGPSVTKLFFQNKLERYDTTVEARRGLVAFDKTGTFPFTPGKFHLGAPISMKNDLDRERVRVKKLRAQGKCFENGARAKFGKRKSARDINARRSNFGQIILRQRAQLANTTLELVSTQQV